jgi:hypothetical protein
VFDCTQQFGTSLWFGYQWLYGGTAGELSGELKTQPATDTHPVLERHFEDEMSDTSVSDLVMESPDEQPIREIGRAHV